MTDQKDDARLVNGGALSEPADFSVGDGDAAAFWLETNGYDKGVQVNSGDNEVGGLGAGAENGGGWAKIAYQEERKSDNSGAECGWDQKTLRSQNTSSYIKDTMRGKHKQDLKNKLFYKKTLDNFGRGVYTRISLS